MIFGLFPLLIVVVALVALFSGRSEDDPNRERPLALYLSVAGLLGVVLLLAGTYMTLSGVVGLTDGQSGSARGFSFTSSKNSTVEFAPVPPRSLRKLAPGGAWSAYPGRSNHDDDVARILTGLIVTAIGFGVVRFHSPKLRQLTEGSNGPGARVASRYFYAVCFVSMLTAIGAAGAAVYAAAGWIAPDTLGFGSHFDGLRTLIVTGVLAIVALVIFRREWGHAEALATPKRTLGFTPPAAPTPPAPRGPTPPPAPPAKKAAAAKKAPPRRT